MTAGWKRLLGAALLAIVIVEVGVLVWPADDPAPPPEPRFHDLYGRVADAGRPDVAFAEAGEQRVIGPAEIRVAGKPVVVPRGTPVHGSCQGFFSPPSGFPCFAQVGLQADGTTAKWIQVFNTFVHLDAARRKTYRVEWDGDVREVRGDTIIFADGSVIPAPDVKVQCGTEESLASALARDPELDAAHGWGVTIDETTGRAVTLGCVGDL